MTVFCAVQLDGSTYALLDILMGALIGVGVAWLRWGRRWRPDGDTTPD